MLCLPARRQAVRLNLRVKVENCVSHPGPAQPGSSSPPLPGSHSCHHATATDDESAGGVCGKDRSWLLID
jgi:hypothetical protein